MNSYNVIFKGEIAEGKDRDKLSQALAKFLKVPEAKAHLLFSGNPICIKKALSEVEANTLKAKLNTVGIITYIKPAAIQTSSTTAEVTVPQKVSKPTIEAKSATAAKPTEKSYDDLSKGWQKVFAEFDLRQADKLGYFASANNPAHTSRPKSQQVKGNYIVGFNALAFFFGPLYYMVKGMWKKGIYLFVLLSIFNILCLAILSLVTDKDLSPLVYIISSSFCASIAHYDYYRYYKLGETTWPWMPQWMGSPKNIGITVIGLILGIGTLFLVGGGSDINRVKNSPLPYFNEYKMGAALDLFSNCDEVRWEEFEDKRGLNIVQYTCNVFRPEVESNLVAELKMINEFFDNELKKPNAKHADLEEERKEWLSRWPEQMKQPKQYNIIAQFSLIKDETLPKVLYVGIDSIYPDGERRNQPFGDNVFFQYIGNDTPFTSEPKGPKTPAFNHSLDMARLYIPTTRKVTP